MNNKNINTMKKEELLNILMDEYGYSKDDLKKDDGTIFTNPALRALIKQEISDEEEFSTSKTEVRKQYNDNDLIQVMNGLSGSLTHRSDSTGRVWRFKRFGVISKLPYSEILHIFNSYPKVFEECWLIILDKQIVADFDLNKVYSNILTPDNVKTIFEKENDELEVFIKNMPEASKVTFMDVTRNLYENKKIDSVSKLELIESIYNISLKDNAPLDDVIISSEGKNNG